MELKEYQSQTLATLSGFLDDAKGSTLGDAFARWAHPEPKTALVPEYRPLRDPDGGVIDALAGVPYVAIRIPTGGGKTLMGAHFIRAAADHWLDADRPLVVWLVPSKTIKQQTLAAFKNPRHPYRQELDAAFDGKVSVFDGEDIDQLTPDELAQRTCIVVMTMASARVRDIEIRDFYAHKESLEPHFVSLPKEGLPDLEPQEGKTAPRFSFANLLRLYRPLVITDEAHNATSELSGKVYERLAPSAIVELTATPDLSTSNVLVRVSASQLFAEQMIKLPVLLEEHKDGWDAALRHALLRRQALEDEAKQEPEYVRPILLVQAEHAGGEATVEVIHNHLVAEDGERIPKEWIAVATGTQRELDDLDLFDPECPVRVVITMEALKEGWDCSFAYVLCSVAKTKSATSIEQLLGRVLRMPYAESRQRPALNKAYAHVVSPVFGEKATEFTQHLENMGFSRLEAAQAIAPPVQPELPGVAVPPRKRTETVQITTDKAPKLEDAPNADLAKITVEPSQEEGKFVVIVEGAIAEETVEIIAKANTGKGREEARTKLELHNTRANLRTTPAQQGVAFEVPWLSFAFGDQTIPLAGDLLAEDGFWSPGENAGTLDTLTFDAQTRTWEIHLGERKVLFKPTDEPQVQYLAGLTGNWTSMDLILWLDGKVRQPDVKSEAMVAWIAHALKPLERKGYTLGQLVRARFVIARRLLALLAEARARRSEQAYQRMFDLPEVVVDPASVFKFDGLAYPMRWACPAPVEWTKHFYDTPGDLPYQRKDGKLAEEYVCALAIEGHPEIEVWVRNLSHPSQFRFPVGSGFTYPDFIARLKDGRILVLEYKGEDRYDSAKNQAKRAVGELWARKNPRGLYLMAREKDDDGLDIDGQIAKVIAG